MSENFVKQIVIKNWYLFVLLVAFLVTAVFQLFAPGKGEVEALAAPGSQVARVERTAPSVAPRDLVADEQAKLREEAMAKIRENEAALAAHPEPEKAAAYTNGIANMYFQRLQDYSAAASHYERVLSDYPEAPLKYQTFVQLVQCYEKLNDQDKRRVTLRRMMEAYPSDSQEHIYAHSELYGELPATAQPSDAAVEATDSADREVSEPSAKVAAASAVQ